MIRSLLIAALLLAACTGDPVVEGSVLRYAHDPVHGVGCWSWGSTYGIYCLPDSEYRVVQP